MKQCNHKLLKTRDLHVECCAYCGVCKATGKTNPCGCDNNQLECTNKEPATSIKGVLIDVKAGKLSVDEALVEIMGYMK